ncbi:bifunctional methionine sulfoxide reductase B/A protein [Paraferrimonas sp. SM1919]|uniref:bifunctional methionine sulfoxide reductase B/A protein n=1 Tax=Paraferrimonas sp. SM1919 TaxID=2662263 RepID=UPI0013D83406|nr:bifunctional methionine sulfoxide reductase B/A protein [Paraferrimonas sp. SM1919]
MSNQPLTDFEKHVILNKGTEPPFSGQYHDHFEQGVYCCRACDAPLYLSEDKFQSHCGWPSFDDEIPFAVAREVDADGRRTEILCHNCGGHLGHVFNGERLTPKNTRHCVNSVSMQFKPVKTQLATFAGGCFWCLEAFFQPIKGVLKVTSGYCGGNAETANYQQVCCGQTQHAEAVQIIYDDNLISYQTLLELFFGCHDPTTLNRQGNDTGPQYRSAIFYHNDKQKQLAAEAMANLETLEYEAETIVTELVEAKAFYQAEPEHHNYYMQHPYQGYCQVVISPKMHKLKQNYSKLVKEHLL